MEGGGSAWEKMKRADLEKSASPKKIKKREGGMELCCCPLEKRRKRSELVKESESASEGGGGASEVHPRFSRRTRGCERRAVEDDPGGNYPEVRKEDANTLLSDGRGEKRGGKVRRKRRAKSLLSRHEMKKKNG